MIDSNDTPRNLEKQELSARLKNIPALPQTESDCVESTKVIESLAKIGAFEDDMADRLQAILFFIPRGSYRELFWPQTWVKASRLLREQGFINKLREVACSQETHYLSAVGAISLASTGFLSGDVLEWLKNTRDYFLLTEGERHELERILLQLGDAEQELAQLRSKFGSA